MQRETWHRLLTVVLTLFCLVGILLAGIAAVRYTRETQAAVSSLLSTREDALVEGDVAAFLATVDPQNPALRCDEESFARAGVGKYSNCWLSFNALRVVPGGRKATAKISQILWVNGNDMGFKATYTATFVRHDGTWYFAGYTPGKISRRLPGGCTVTVEYSFGLRRDAAALLRAAARYAREYTALYGAAPPRVHITLYQTPRELRNTVEAGRFEKLYLWHEPGGSIRMCFAPGQDTAANLPALRREMNSHWIHSLSGGNAAAFLCDGLNALNQTENALQQTVQPCTVTANGFADTGPVDPETLPAYLAASYHVRAASYAAALCNEYGFDAIARALPIMARAPMAQSPDAALEITMAALQEVTGDTLTAADMDALRQKWSQSAP